jgi:hypothetical protein
MKKSFPQDVREGGGFDTGFIGRVGWKDKKLG